ncbi:sugar ABC transporter substrate-binding protein [Rubellimicrobium arenae]|uniref:sugar ABC transporter substrate-binding protein n=1 Tax=Rubellimicrobium arenae TaxID=2817372 RepID=UPI001B3076C1|nr:sugar ABC transporter substrate-binding protein [Rubellimicrobium arenae]
MTLWRQVPGGLIRRRTLLQGMAGLAAVGAMGRPARAQDMPTLVNSIRSLSNPYHATWNQGGEAFAAAIGAPYVTLVTEGDSEKGIADIRAILQKTGGNAVINVDPNDAPDARPIVEACVQAGAHVLTQWNKPADLHPWDFNPNYVSHVSFDGVEYGGRTAQVLIDAIGGSGGIVALGGILSNTAAIDRRTGLEATLAANPNVELLDFQVADWQSGKAFDTTSAWLTRFGPDIKGIWAANDDMAIGALEALRAEGLQGQIPITGIDGIQTAVEAVRAGEMTATVFWDPFWQGAMGLSIPYHARTGTFDPAAEPPEHREFYGSATVVTTENAESFYAEHIAATPQLDFEDLWGRVSGQIRQS